MFADINIQSSAYDSLSPLRILLAESDPIEIDRLRSNIDRKFQAGIQISSNYDDLLTRITTEQPQLMMLGRIDRSNYFEICEECHKISENLPIVLISRQKVIDTFFRRLAHSWGAIDVIINNQIELDRILQGLERPISSELLDKSDPITGQSILTGLREIATITNNYFGPLAQGNYWRKAHSRLVDEFPFILNWSADHFGQLSCSERMLGAKLTEQEIYSLQVWVWMFIGECDRSIVDFGEILTNLVLSPTAKYLLAKS